MHIQDLDSKQREEFRRTVDALRKEIECTEAEAVYWVADDWGCECDEPKPLTFWDAVMRGEVAAQDLVDRGPSEDDYSEESYP